MKEQMGFSNFTAKWQTNLDEKDGGEGGWRMEVKEESSTFRFEVLGEFS